MVRALRSIALVAAAGLILAGCGSTSASHHGTTTTTVIKVACRNRVATPSLKASLVAADARAGAMTVPGSVFYGTCGATQYAVATFAPSPSATAAESVAFQDHGAYPEFFERADHGRWRIVGSAPGPPGLKGCATFTHLPTGLRAIWGTCVTSTTTTTTLAPWCVTLMSDTFIEAQSVVINADGSANVKGMALGVRCAPGTLDDAQFHYRVAGESPETVHLVAGAAITGVNLPGGVKPLALSALAHYLARDTDGNIFQVIGPLDAATKLLGHFHP